MSFVLRLLRVYTLHFCIGMILMIGSVWVFAQNSEQSSALLEGWKGVFIAVWFGVTRWGLPLLLGFGIHMGLMFTILTFRRRSPLPRHRIAALHGALIALVSGGVLIVLKGGIGEPIAGAALFLYTFQGAFIGWSISRLRRKRSRTKTEGMASKAVGK